MEEVLRGTWVVAYRELLRFFQERATLISSIAMPLLFLVIFGAGFTRVIGAMTPGVDYLQFIYPGIVAMTVLMNSVMSGLSVVWDREFGFLKEILVAPLARSGIVLGKALGAACISVAQGFIMLVLAPILGVTITPLMVAQLVPVMIVVSLSLAGLGIVVASRMRSQRGFQIIVQIMIMPLLFLSGAFFPVNNVPAWLEVISKLNPMTYGVDAIRQVFLGAKVASTGGAQVIGVTVLGHTMTVWQDVLVVAAIGLVLMAAAMWSFSRQE